MNIDKYLRRFLQHVFNVKDGYNDIHRYRKEAVSYISSSVSREAVFPELKKIIEHAYKKTEYYKKCWDKAGFDPSKFKNLNDLALIPFVTKETIQTEKERMVASGYRNHIESSHTGGSSGNPTTFYRDKKCSAIRMGRQAGILEFCGYEPGDRCGLLWGAHADLNLSVVSGIKRRLRQFASGKQTLCCTVMEEDKMFDFHKELIKFKPKIIYGYPNAIAEFADFIENKKLEPVKASKIFCTAESLSERQRKKLSDIFSGEVYNLYCTREHGCIGFECEKHNGFHIDTGSVFVETVNVTDTGSDVFGDVVVTDLLNYGMPLIRNKIGDVGVLSDKPCSCGCSLPLLKQFSGRHTDLLYKKDKTPVAGIMLLDLMADVSEIKWIQIIQDSFDTIDINLVVADGYNKAIEQVLIRQLDELFDGQTLFRFHIVDEISRNPNSGKYREVMCRVSD